MTTGYGRGSGAYCAVILFCRFYPDFLKPHTGAVDNEERVHLRASRVDGGIGLGLETFTTGQDALLQVGESAETGFLVASDSNSFNGAATNLDVDVHKVGTTPSRVTISLDTSKVRDMVTSFVRNFNSFVDSAKTLTKYNPETNQRGVLQGQGFVLRAVSRLESLVTRRHLGSGEDVRSLIDLGVRIGTGGKLIIDASQLNAALEDHPEAVAKFFLDEDNGFAKHADETSKALIDPFTGSFALENTVLKNSIDSLTERVEHLDEILLARRDRLLKKFIAMEQTLRVLTSQQASIGGIAQLNVREL